MANAVMLYPFLSDELIRKIRFQKSKVSFFYTDRNGEEFELEDEPLEAFSSIYGIKDENGKWDQDNDNIGFRRRYLLRNFQCLFGENGIVCRNAVLGMAVVWTSSDSKQRGVIPVGTFTVNDQQIEVLAEKIFDKAQLRGRVDFTTILYIASAGTPSEKELHLANTNGFTLGELESFAIKLDGKGSKFPIFEVHTPGQPLWYVDCNWDDPTQDSFSETVAVYLNTAHKNYRYIDRNQSVYNNQLLSEIMAAALSVIIETLRSEHEYWEQILNNENLEEGSVGQAVFYFSDALGWDLSSPRLVSIYARKYFDQRM